MDMRAGWIAVQSDSVVTSQSVPVYVFLNYSCLNEMLMSVLNLKAELCTGLSVGA